MAGAGAGATAGAALNWKGEAAAAGFEADVPPPKAKGWLAAGGLPDWEAPNVNGDDVLVVLAGSDFPKLKTPAAAVGFAGSALKALPEFEPKVGFEAPDPNALFC
mgnify:CR=1 FL=1